MHVVHWKLITLEITELGMKRRSLEMTLIVKLLSVAEFFLKLLFL